MHSSSSSQSATEKTGGNFSETLLEFASARTLEVIQNTAALIRPGMTEADGKTILQEQLKKFGAESFWHSPKIRFGINTLKTYGQTAEPGVVLQENDIFFLDIGPVFSGHEGDVGRTFAVGSDPEYLRAAKDVELIWQKARNHWKTHKESGRELYDFASNAAHERGWKLVFKEANGHRISEFPHKVHHRGNIQDLEFAPNANRWILEIQIRHPERPFGAFYEDLLN